MCVCERDSFFLDVKFNVQETYERLDFKTGLDTATHTLKDFKTSIYIDKTNSKTRFIQRKSTCFLNSPFG